MTVLRREALTAGLVGGAAVLASAAKAASFGNPDEPPQGAINAHSPGSNAIPGPQSLSLADRFPGSI